MKYPLLAVPLSFLLLLLITVSARAQGESVPEIRVMSFNVRNSGAKDGANGWSHRKGLFFATIDEFNPDLLGTQEVLADQYDDIVAHMKGYTPVGVARDDGKRKGEWALILFRNDRFEQVDGGNFWLSKTPDVPGSKSWDAALTRICSWVRLKDRRTGREFIFGNTHYDHVGHVARENASKIIMTKLPELSHGQPVILTGDFNTTEDDPPYKTITHPTEPGMAHFTDSYREVHPHRLPGEASFHGFKGGTKGSRIDFILHTPELQATAAEIDRNKSAEGHYPSDHYAVTAVLQWK
jgi:endonuclease/exonuclease/phosphatase family metal-dependent hydrolase